MPRIQLKLMGALALLVVAVVAAVGGLAERGLRSRELGRIEQSLADNANLVRELLRGARPATVEGYDALADAAGAAVGARVTLIERGGRVVGDSEVPVSLLSGLQNHAQRPEVVEALQGRAGRATRTSATVRRPLVYVALPPDEASQQLVVRLAVDVTQAQGAIAELRAELVAAGAIGLGVALLLSFVITRFTLRPVEELRTVVTDIADGRLERRFEWDTRDEIGEIGESINRVAGQLRSRLDEENAERTRLEAVLGSMVEGVLVLDASGKVTLANPRLQELLDVWSDPTGKSPLSLSRNEALDRTLAEARRQPEPQVCELEVPTRDELQRLLDHVVEHQDEAFSSTAEKKALPGGSS